MNKHHRTWRGLVFIATSLDGMIARNDDDLDWLTDQPTGRHHAPALEPQLLRPPNYEEFMASVTHIVMGRGTYEKVLTFNDWPYSSKRVYVLSTTLTRQDLNVTVLGSTAEVVKALNEDGAGGVYVDGGKVIQEFLREGLIDEITVSTAPVLIGEGISLFGALDDDVLLTHKATSYGDNGMVGSTFIVNHDD